MNESNPTVQTSEPAKTAAADRLKYTRSSITIVRRSEKAGSKFTTRIRFKGKVYPLTLCDTVEESFKAAVLARREIHANRWHAFKEATTLRAPERFATLEEIRKAYLAFPGGDRGIKYKTKERNLQALVRFLRAAGVEDSDPISTVFTQKLVADWKWSRRELSSAQDDEGNTRVIRSSQSELLQARSVFSPEAQSYYRERANLKLPACIKAFCDEPGFTNIGKEEYHAPSDTIIANTFSAIDNLIAGKAELDEMSRNMYVAFWLAVGFGLRASEIAKAQNKDFQQVDGDVFFRPDWQTKNKKICEIGVQLDAWQRLAPYLKGDPETFAILGTMTDRHSNVVRGLSTLFKTLGWKTTHHIHEMRAWAGCQIAMNHPQGLLYAQMFLRHSSYTTTQKFYGHHIKVRGDKVALRIPTITVSQPIYTAPTEANRLVFN
jgi:integrase